MTSHILKTTMRKNPAGTRGRIGGTKMISLMEGDTGKRRRGGDNKNPGRMDGAGQKRIKDLKLPLPHILWWVSSYIFSW